MRIARIRGSQDDSSLPNPLITKSKTNLFGRAFPEGLGFYAMNIKSCYGYMI